MSSHLDHERVVRIKYRSELNEAYKKLDEIQDKIKKEVEELEKLDEKNLLNIKQDEKEGIKTKGCTIQDILLEFKEYKHSSELDLELDLPTLNYDWYLKIKKLYPTYNISKDIVECKREDLFDCSFLLFI